MITLGGIVLNRNLILEDEFAANLSGQVVETTISGRRVITKSVVSGKPNLVLSARRTGSQFSGYFSRDEILQIKEFERNNVAVPFIYGTQSYSVLVASGGVKVTPLLEYGESFSDEDLYTGTITLLEV